jgi:uncharacterized protein
MMLLPGSCCDRNLATNDNVYYPHYGRGAMKDLLRYIVQAMVDNPDQVRINEVKGDQITVLELTVAKSDLGKVIGKQGRNAAAIRAIVNSAAAKNRIRVNVEIMDQ